MTTTKSAESTRCTECRRPLTSAASIARGRGRTCDRKARRRAAVASDFKPAQIEKATELIQQGAIVPLRSRRVFTVVASNGIDRYLTGLQGCNCPAGLKSRPCYHVAAARMIAA